METVSDYLSKKGSGVCTVRPDVTVYEALELMAEKNIGAVVVADEKGKLCGMFSERDFARKMIIKGRDSQTTRVGQVMTTTVISVKPETLMLDCMSLMTEKRIRHLPVLAEGRLVGLISIGDVVKSVLSEKDHVISQQAYMIDQLESYISYTP